MMTEICAILHNYFCDAKDIHKGEFTISGGKITPLDFLKEGQYFRIVGSVLNDGVYKYSDDTTLQDETFKGAIWAMSVPPSLVALASEIEKFNTDNQASAYTSESFAGYSYSKATDKNGVPASWKTVYASRLNQWRKI